MISICVALLFLLLTDIRINSIEISLEENRAEMGTVGYVDIKKIFDKFSPEIRKKLDNEIKKRQEDIDLMKKEIFHLKSVREKLMWEYEIAKMYEDFVSKIKEQKEPQISQISSTQEISVSTGFINDVSIQNSSQTISENQLQGSDVSSQDQSLEPYITMPGVGNIPISVFKFSFSSSTLLIDGEIKRLEKKIQDTEKKLLELKDKYDNEISIEMEKENIGVFKKIYQAIEEVAKMEGISVVIDKRNILFGIKSIDLTQKIIQKIESER